MQTEKIRGEMKLNLELANKIWTVNQWIQWAVRNRVGLIIEDGHVVGWENRPQRFTL